MKYAIIENGIVTNIILGCEVFAASCGLTTVLVEGLTVCIGYTYTDGVFSPPVPAAPNYPVLINKKIEYFQSEAPKLLRELYTENTLAGITTAQSDTMFDDYADVLNRIREGAFPTAIYRLQQKVPLGFVTQGLIDAWIIKIQKYL